MEMVVFGERINVMWVFIFFNYINSKIEYLKKIIDFIILMIFFSGDFFFLCIIFEISWVNFLKFL